MTFRTFYRIGGALLVALLTPLAAHGQGRTDVPIEPMSVKMSHVGGLAYAALYIAHDKGYFKERGLDVELVLVRGGDTAFQVAGGTLQFAGGSPDSAFFNALDRGLPLVAIGSLAVNDKDDSSTPMMVRKDLHDAGTVTKVEHLKGRKVANLVPGGITEYLVGLALAVGDLKIEDTDYVSPMGFRQMVDALQTKAIDAALISEPLATLSVRQNIAVKLSRAHDLGEQILFIKSNREFVDKHPNVAVNFLIAYLKGTRDLAGDGFTNDENLAILETNTRVPAAAIKAATRPVLPADGQFNLDSIMAQQRFHMSRGKLTYDTPMPIERFLDRSYLERALAFLGPHKS